MCWAVGGHAPSCFFKKCRERHKNKKVTHFLACAKICNFFPPENQCKSISRFPTISLMVVFAMVSTLW